MSVLPPVTTLTESEDESNAALHATAKSAPEPKQVPRKSALRNGKPKESEPGTHPEEVPEPKAKAKTKAKVMAAKPKPKMEPKAKGKGKAEAKTKVKAKAKGTAKRKNVGDEETPDAIGEQAEEGADVEASYPSFSIVHYSSCSNASANLTFNE